MGEVAYAPMASPAFIYAFDNLGQDRFVELCGLLLGARYRGFLLGGPGPDGGIDAETSAALGLLVHESRALLLDKQLQPGELTIFQFKHKTTARTGQANARSQLLKQYRSTRRKPGELHAVSVGNRAPAAYVLVTNVEVSADFRSSFRNLCRKENSDIKHYEVIGLDDLQGWVTQDRILRAQFFPTLFGFPRFNLALRLRVGQTATPNDWSPGVFRAGGKINFTIDRHVVCIHVMNTGEAVSYLSDIKFKALADGKIVYCMPPPLPRGEDPLANPPFGEPINPGQSQRFLYDFEMFRSASKGCKEFLLAEMMVWDQIDNLYVCEVPDEVRDAIYGTA